MWVVTGAASLLLIALTFIPDRLRDLATSAFAWTHDTLVEQLDELEGR